MPDKTVTSLRDQQMAEMDPVVRKCAERMEADITPIYRTLVDASDSFGLRDPKKAKKVTASVIKALRHAWLAGSEYESEEINADLDRLGAK